MPPQPNGISGPQAEAAVPGSSSPNTGKGISGYTAPGSAIHTTTPTTKTDQAGLPKFNMPNFGSIGTHIKGLFNQVPSNLGHAKQQLDRFNNPNLTWTSQEKWDSARELSKWYEQNKNNELVRRYVEARPDIKSNLQLFNSPLGQVGQTIAPAIGGLAKNPQQFASLAAIPGIQQLFQGTMGLAGTPGLALAHSFLSGDMKNWNDLTAGINDPNSRVPGRNFNKEIQGLLPYQKSAGDAIDQYLARMANYKRDGSHDNNSKI